MLRAEALRVQTWIALLMACLLALSPEAAAQAPAPSPATASQAPNLAPQAPAPLPAESLAVYILEGQNQIHDIRNPITAMAVVEVRDENALPVEGADVTFELPKTGAGGAFAGQASTYSTKTNSQGQAVATFLPNVQTGRFTIRVSAKLGNRTGHALITQTNARRSGVAEPKAGLFKFAWWKVAVLGAVGATVAILLTRGSSSSSVTLIPGTPTFGAP